MVVQLEHLWTILNIVAACVVEARPIDGSRLNTEWTLNGDCDLQMVDHFCYLGDTIGAGGGCVFYHRKGQSCMGESLVSYFPCSLPEYSS